MGLTLAILFSAYTTQFNLPPELLASVCYVESKYDVTAVHEDDGASDSLGVCQVKLATARWLGYPGGEEGLMDPAVNAYYAAKYLHHQLARYNGAVNLAVIAYNQGSARQLTRTQYSDKVFKRWRQVYAY